MRPDPKFGWHIYWIMPVVYIGSLIGALVDWYKEYKHRKHIAAIMKDPEIAKIVNLAGIKDTK
jgi:hypothetical protein